MSGQENSNSNSSAPNNVQTMVKALGGGAAAAPPFTPLTPDLGSPKPPEIPSVDMPASAGNQQHMFSLPEQAVAPPLTGEEPPGMDNSNGNIPPQIMSMLNALRSGNASGEDMFGFSGTTPMASQNVQGQPQPYGGFSNPMSTG